MLLFGTGDGYLYAVDISTADILWRFQTGTAISTTPVLWGNLCVVGTKSGKVHTLDADSGEEQWQFDVGCPVAGLIIDDGTIYITSTKGELVALPWHIGHWGWAAAWSEKQNWQGETPAFHALASDSEVDLETRQSHANRAIMTWRGTLAPEQAAWFREGIGDPKMHIAEEYEYAARKLRPRDRLRAAKLYLEASRLYEEAVCLSQAKRCYEHVLRLAPVPRLQISGVDLSALEFRKTGQIIFEVRNEGIAPAHNVSIGFSGQLVRTGRCSLISSMKAGACLKIVADNITLLRGDLLVILYYNSDWQNISLRTEKHFTPDIQIPGSKTVSAENSISSK